MRLAIVTHNVVRGDGQGRANYEIVRRASRIGVQVSLIADRVDDDVLTWQNVDWIKIQPKIRSNWLVHGFDFMLQANRLLKRTGKDYDVIHGYGATLTVPHHINTVQFVHSAWLRSPVHTARQQRDLYGAYQWLYSRLNATWEVSAFRRARQITAVSQIVRQDLEALKVTTAPIPVIPNGVDLAEFHPGTEDRASDRTALGLPTDVPLGLFAGDIRTPRKNLDTVLRGLVEAPTVHLAVVGKLAGSPYPEMARQLGIESRVHFLDYRRDMADIMRAVDLFVFPSRYEPFGMVVVEAMACGVPVITARTTGAAEAVTPDCGVVLEDSEDVAGLSAALRRIAGDDDLRRAMSAASAAKAREYEWERIADRYVALYEKMAT